MTQTEKLQEQVIHDLGEILLEAKADKDKIPTAIKRIRAIPGILFKADDQRLPKIQPLIERRVSQALEDNTLEIQEQAKQEVAREIISDLEWDLQQATQTRRSVLKVVIRHIESCYLGNKGGGE